MSARRADEAATATQPGPALRSTATNTSAKVLPLPTDEDWWQRLPDLLQAQVAVALESRARREARYQSRAPPEELLWVSTPFIRTSTLIQYFLVWTLLLLLPVPFLVELFHHGGYLALVWSLASVFLFVPRITRSSREAFVLTSCRAFVSIRTMYCSITTEQLDYSEVTAAKVGINKDRTGTIELRSNLPARGADPRAPFTYERVIRFDHLRDLKDACRVLNQKLPAEVVASAGLSG